MAPGGSGFGVGSGGHLSLLEHPVTSSSGTFFSSIKGLDQRWANSGAFLPGDVIMVSSIGDGGRAAGAGAAPAAPAAPAPADAAAGSAGLSKVRSIIDAESDAMLGMGSGGQSEAT